jgi:outer membrane protein assembly factor BamB
MNGVYWPRLAAASAITITLGFVPIFQPCRAASAVAFQIDPAHDGNIKFKSGFSPPLTRIWVRSLDGPVSYPLIANGLVFVTVGDLQNYGTNLLAFDIGSGDTVWTRKIQGSGLNYWSAAAYDKGRVFVINDFGQLQAFSADRSGQALWSVQLYQSWVSGAPIAHGGLVFVAGYGSLGALSGIDEATGILKWEQRVDYGGDGAPAFGDGGVYATYTCQYYKFAPASGQLIWHDDGGCHGGGGDTPAYYRKRLYVRDGFGLGDRVLDADTGRVVSSLAAQLLPAFFHDATGRDLEITPFDGNLYAVDLATDNVVWTGSGFGGVSVSPIVINGIVVVASSSGGLYLLDGQTGDILWSGNTGAPVVPARGITAPLIGLGAGEGALVVPGTNQLALYMPQ